MTAARTEITTARRIVVKVGSSSLTTRSGGIDVDRVNSLVKVIAEKKLSGTQIILVSSGAIAAGLAPLGLASRPSDVATQQAAAVRRWRVGGQAGRQGLWLVGPAGIVS